MAFDASADAEILYEAMKGLGTNDEKLIEIIGTRSNSQLQQIRREYQEKYGKDLVDAVKGETSGPYEELLVGLLLKPAEFDALTVKQGLSGIGTDEPLIVQTLCHRSNEELDAIKAAYAEKYGKALEDDLKSDFGGGAEQFLLLLVQRTKGHLAPSEVPALIDTLYQSGQGRLGTDEGSFMDIFSKYDAGFLKYLSEQYCLAKGDTLDTIIESEFSSTLRDCLLALTKSSEDYYADLIYGATADKTGTDEKTLVRVVASRRAHMAEINKAYMAKYHQSINNRIDKEVGGDLKKLLLLAAAGCGEV